MLLPDILRQSISASHKSIESTPLAAAMISGQITRPVYAWWMTQMSHLHKSFEHAMTHVEIFDMLYDPTTMNRSATLARDGVALDVEHVEPIDSSLDRFGSVMGKWSIERPWKLLGALYVLEGSRMGSLALARPISRALGISMQVGMGLDYHIEGAAQRPQTWQRFRGILAQMPFTESQIVDVKDAAMQTMQILCDLYAAAPMTENMTNHEVLLTANVH